jgi:hypothetical protein
MRAVPSKEAVATQAPSGLHATAFTSSRWPSSSAMHSPLSTSKMRAVWSLDAEATRAPSGE